MFGIEHFIISSANVGLYSFLVQINTGMFQAQYHAVCSLGVAKLHAINLALESVTPRVKNKVSEVIWEANILQNSWDLHANVSSLLSGSSACAE